MRLKIITKDGPRRWNRDLPITFTKLDLYRLRRREVIIWITSNVFIRGKLRVLRVYPPHPISGDREVIFMLSVRGRETSCAEITFTYDNIQKSVDDGGCPELYIAL